MTENSPLRHETAHKTYGVQYERIVDLRHEIRDGVKSEKKRIELNGVLLEARDALLHENLEDFERIVSQLEAQLPNARRGKIDDEDPHDSK